MKLINIAQNSNMSDDDDDLFGDSGGDTDDLIAESKKDSKPIAKPKKLTKKKAAPNKRKRADIPGMLCVHVALLSFIHSLVTERW